MDDDLPDERTIDERIQAALRQLPALPTWTAHERMAHLLDRIGADDSDQDVLSDPDGT